jgi:hypothetical protein
MIMMMGFDSQIPLEEEPIPPPLPRDAIAGGGAVSAEQQPSDAAAGGPSPVQLTQQQTAGGPAASSAIADPEGITYSVDLLKFIRPLGEAQWDYYSVGFLKKKIKQEEGVSEAEAERLISLASSAKDLELREKSSVVVLRPDGSSSVREVTHFKKDAMRILVSKLKEISKLPDPLKLIFLSGFAAGGGEQFNREMTLFLENEEKERKAYLQSQQQVDNAP